MTAISTRLNESTDSLLRFAMRADAILTGVAGIAAIPLAGWMAQLSGTTRAFEYSMSAFFIAYGIVVLVVVIALATVFVRYTDSLGHRQAHV